jgi:hypothetical protein
LHQRSQKLRLDHFGHRVTVHIEPSAAVVVLLDIDGTSTGIALSPGDAIIEGCEAIRRDGVGLRIAGPQSFPPDPDFASPCEVRVWAESVAESAS